MVTEIELFESPGVSPLGICLWGFDEEHISKRKVDT